MVDVMFAGTKYPYIFYRCKNVTGQRVTADGLLGGQIV
jgi:hypothetical protein